MKRLGPALTFFAESRFHRSFSSFRPHQRSLESPLNLPKWLKDNSHLLKPPVNNYYIHKEHMIVMVVGGPNARTDYHINQTPEFFYQHKGRMLLKVIDEGEFRDIYIDEGEMFTLPPGVPHNPVRFADTVGVVVEQLRPGDSMDHLRWYCQNCKHLVNEVSFRCVDLGAQIKQAVEEFKADTKTRTCAKCGELCDVIPRTDHVSHQ